MRRRDDALAVAALAALAAALLSDALLSGGAVLPSHPRADLAAQFLAWRAFAAEQLRAGRLPLWNPRVFCGMPFLGAFESALLYPSTWLHLALGLGAAVNATLWAHLALAGGGAYAFGRTRGLEPPEAALCGACFMLGAPFFRLLYGGHLPELCSAAWLPVVFVALEGWLKTRRGRWLAGLSAALAMQLLAGNPQVLYNTLLVAAVYAGLRARAETGRLRLIAGAAGAVVFSAALCAPQLAAGWLAARESVRGGGSYLATTFALPLASVLTATAPLVFGGGAAPYFGPLYFWEGSLYIAASCLALALLAMARGGREDGPLKWAAAAALIVAASPAIPGLRAAAALIPGMAMLRGASKLALPASLLGATLAASGARALRRQEGERFWLFCAAAAASLGLGALACARTGPWLAAPPPELAPWARGWQARQLALAGLWLGALAAAAAITRRRLGWAVVALCSIELAWSARASRASMTLETDYPAAWRAGLSSLGPDDRVLHDPLTDPNAAMRLGVDDVWGYASLAPRRTAQFLAFTQAAPFEDAAQYLAFRRWPRVLALTRLRRVFQRGRPPLELRAPLRRAQVLHSWRLAADARQAFRAMARPGFDPGREAVLERPPSPPPEAALGGDAAAVIEARPGEAVVEASLRSAGLLLITDSFSAGWRAEPLAAGPQARYDVLAADRAFMAIPLAAGRHRLRLRYEPPGYRAGWAVALLAWLALAAAPLLARLTASRVW